MNISLPAAMRAWLDRQVTRGGFGSASEYFRQLIRAEQKRQLRDQIDARLLESLASGPPAAADSAYWRRLRREARRRAARKKPA